MTSAARIRANRENARRSTGPRTAAGKQRASANARRHGLAISIDGTPEQSAEVEQLARLIAGASANDECLHLARKIAAAEVDLKRIQRARHAVEKVMVEDPEAWVDQTVPQFHFRRGTSKDLSQVLIAVRLAQAKATNARSPAFSDWSRTLRLLDRYERRALSRRKAAARELAEL